jgi:hypothetical protein
MPIPRNIAENIPHTRAHFSQGDTNLVMDSQRPINLLPSNFFARI